MKKFAMTIIFLILLIVYAKAEHSYTINIIKLPEYTHQETTVISHGLNISGPYIATESFVQPDVPRSLVYILYEDAWGPPIASCIITTWGKNQFGQNIRTQTYLGSGLFMKENPQIFSEITRMEIHGIGTSMGDLLYVGLGRKFGIEHYFEYTNDVWNVTGTSDYHIDVRYKSLRVFDLDTVPVDIAMTVADKSLGDIPIPTPTVTPSPTPTPSPTVTPEYTPDGSAEKPWMVTNLAELQAVNDGVNDHYIQMSNIDATDTEGWNEGDGFVPIGENLDRFSGTYDGNGYTIHGLYINRPTSDDMGLFGRVDEGGLITRVHLTSATVVGQASVACLVARISGGTVSYSSVTSSSVMGSGQRVGLVGGYVQAACHFNYNYATGYLLRHWGSDAVQMYGGFIGQNYRASVAENYSSVQTTNLDTYGMSAFIASQNTGAETYADIRNYYDSEIGVQGSSGNAVGLTTANMMKQASFVDWDFEGIWAIDEDESYPYHDIIYSNPTPTPTPTPTIDPIDPMTTRYVRSDAPAGGDGLSWSTAWQELPYYWAGGGSRKSSDGYLHRGWTYYIADGEYPYYVFDTSVSTSTDTIRILKATDDRHGDSAGWSSAYGDGYTLFTRDPDDFGSILRFRTPNWEFDGRVGYGDGSVQGHGFRVGYPNPPLTETMNIVDFSRLFGGVPVDNVEFTHVEVDGGFAGNPDDLTQVVGRTNAIYIVNPSDDTGTNVNIRYCYLHSVTVAQLRLDGLRNSTVEHCYVSDRIGGHQPAGSSIHGEAISANSSGAAFNTYRYNTFKNIRGTGVIVIKDSVQSDFAIYGNLLINLTSLYTTGNGAIANTGGDTNSNMLVYNNTFIGGFGGNFGVYWDGVGTGNEVYNNLWAGADNMNISSSADHDYNAFWNTGAEISETNKQTIVSDPFVDFAGGNYMLSGATDPGLTLIAPYNLDMTGVIRGNDGTWDRGAFEYVLIP